MIIISIILIIISSLPVQIVYAYAQHELCTGIYAAQACVCMHPHIIGLACDNVNTWIIAVAIQRE